MARQGTTGKRYAALGLVILGHGVFIALFLSPDVGTKAELKNNTSSLLLLDLSMAMLRPNAAPPPKPDTNINKAKKQPSPADRPKNDAAMTQNPAALSPSDSSLRQPGVDWYQQGQQVASSQAETIYKELKRACDEAALHGEHRPECRKYKKPDPWVPEPKKFGIAGGLPYVRLGKRCILGLGFFGCGIGKLPEANGHVLDDGRDPDRPRSSVPAPDE